MEDIKDVKMAEKSKRADIQGLRGIAILSVFVMHLDPESYRLGFVGVDIFFVLSGYLMTEILLKKELSVKSMGNFYSRRFKRIAPVYMIVILFIYIYGYFYMTALDREQILRDIIWACTYTYNLEPFFHDTGYWIQLSSFRFFAHTWSLGVEVQYYLIIPLVLCIASYRTHKARMLLFFLLGALSFTFQLLAASNFSYGFLISRIWQFICGSIAYEMKSKDREVIGEHGLLLYGDKGEQAATEKNSSTSSKVLRFETKDLGWCGWIASAVTYILVTVLLMIPAISSEHVSDNAARTYATFATAIVIYFNINVSLLTNRLMIYCGNLSYVLYLVHWPVILAVRYCSNSEMLSTTGILISIYTCLTLSIAIHHTLELYFMRSTMLPAFACVMMCYVCIFSSRTIYLHTAYKDTTFYNSKINYAIRWNMKEAKYYVHEMSCERDVDTENYTNYTDYPDYRCIAKGNGSASVMLVGDSVACRAHALLHDIFRGRYSKFRLFSKPGCPFLWCSQEMTAAVRKIVQHEKPDIIFFMQRAYARFNSPLTELDTDFVYKQFQSNIEFFRYTKRIVIDMPYCISAVNVGASLARKLYLGLLPGNEFVITWKQCAEQIRYHIIRLRSLKCNKCIMNDVNKALFKEEFFYYYDPRTFLARIADRVHMTSVGLELLRPLYNEIIEELLSTVSG